MQFELAFVKFVIGHYNINNMHIKIKTIKILFREMILAFTYLSHSADYHSTALSLAFIGSIYWHERFQNSITSNLTSFSFILGG
jgi:hypothetical protein